MTKLTTFFLILLVISSCSPEIDPRLSCEIEKFPFEEFKLLPSNGGGLVKMISTESSETYGLFQGESAGLIKLDKNFEVSWIQNVEKMDEASDFTLTDHGKILLAGKSIDTETFEESHLLINIDLEGRILESKKLPLPMNTEVLGITPGEDSGLLVVGNINKGIRDKKSYLCTLNESKEITFDTTLDIKGYTFSHLIKESTGDISFLQIPGFVGFTRDISLFNFNQNKQLQKVKFIANQSGSSIPILFHSIDNDKILFGHSTAISNLNPIHKLSVFDKSHDEILKIEYGNDILSKMQAAKSVDTTSFLISGIGQNCTLLNAPLHISKIDYKGNLIWERLYGGNFSGPQYIFENENGELTFIASMREDPLTNARTSFILRTDSEGRPL